MRRFVVEITRDAFARLQELGERERRTVRAQAAVLLERGLEQDDDACLERPEKQQLEPAR